MTVEEFTKRAQELYDKNEGFAGQEGHRDMDELMAEALRSLGYGAGVDILFSMGCIWYA